MIISKAGIYRNRDAEELGLEQEWPSIVVDVNDPRKAGRIKATNKFYRDLETEDLPWALPRVKPDGKSFSVPELGKVVSITYPSADVYHPVYVNSQHLNHNLQSKLESLTEQAYREFMSISFSARLQFYTEDSQEGMVLDYNKSKIQIDPNGDVIINLRNNNRTLNLGSRDSEQSAMLGDNFLDWMDELIQNLSGQFGGPYLGNMLAPVVPNPKMLEVVNKYFALRRTFKSDHVKIVDNGVVQPNDREFDQIPEGDNFRNNEEERSEDRTGF